MIGRVLAVGYVVVVAGLATFGFAAESAAAILLAGVLTLPTSVPAAIAYYIAYGLLAQVRGANPDSASGHGSCTALGECHGSSTGDLATWFAVTTDVVGILALTVAALLNVVLVRMLLRGSASASGRTRTGA